MNTINNEEKLCGKSRETHSGSEGVLTGSDVGSFLPEVRLLDAYRKRRTGWASSRKDKDMQDCRLSVLSPPSYEVFHQIFRLKKRC